MKRAANRAAFVLLFALLLPLTLGAQNAPEFAVTSAAQPGVGRTLVVIPFENSSPTPGLEWIGESFSETLHQQLNSPVLYVASRNERLHAYDRLGVPVSLHASRATLYRLAEQMDVDYAVLGSYRYDGARLTATAQLLDMRAQRLSPVITETASLVDLGKLQSALAWDLLRQIRNDFSLPKEIYVTGVAPVGLDTLDNYIHGLLASSTDEKIRRYREAVRINSTYAPASLELGKTYYAQRAYEPSIAALAQVPSSSPLASEASFYRGLATFAHGDYAKAADAFEFVAARFPLAEVYNNLGVVAARRGQKKAADYFQKAILNDPSDADYHFNLGVNLAQSGDHAGAIRELRAALDYHPNDSDAKVMLDSLSPPPPGTVVQSAATTKVFPERIKRNYEEDAFRQMTTQIGSWAEQRFARSDPRTHARYHLGLGQELLAHGFTSEAEDEFRHAASVDASSTAPLIALALTYETAGDARQARAQAEAALRVRESADAYLILARLDLRENNPDSAARQINRALQLEPANSAAQDLKHTLVARQPEKGQP